MHLVADRRGFPVHRTAGVLLVFQNMFNGILPPAINIDRHRVTRLSSNRMKICCWRQNLFFFQLLCDLRWPFSGKAEGEYPSYDLRRRLVNIPLLFVAFELLVSIGDRRSNPLAL